ncbi:TraR/DksA C4-type zinc finger protein [Pseudovibrio exalbescens]|uniref:TraR/DksA C4-type zinc finger protein n=1 Tax=Pseudovibrio exalbescens TaxID=197461 RepID=UPI002366B456|nr:TraR/DksA C4-type zinc finger protein [Pseudovibrio exalbescens]MDD7908546.1 TraR/DksA C4-type zinc finger protein [Pseudovibrio exalbescens]
MSFDDVDRANMLAERERDAGVAAIQSKHSLEGREICIDCDEPIGLSRRVANPHATRCIDCQRELEAAR